MLKVKLSGQRESTVTGSGRDGNEAVSGAASEAFARCLHYRYARELPSPGHIV